METPTTKICRRCGIEKPIDQFRRVLKSPDGYTHVCKACLIVRKVKNDALGIVRKLPKGSNPALAEFTPRELIEELKSRGYRGELQFTHTIKM